MEGQWLPVLQFKPSDIGIQSTQNAAERKSTGEQAEIEIDYRDDGILVRQHRCRYNARYVLQVSAPILPAADVNDEDEE